MWLVMVEDSQHRITGRMERSVRKDHEVSDIIWELLNKLQVTSKEVVAVKIGVSHDGDIAGIKRSYFSGVSPRCLGQCNPSYSWSDSINKFIESEGKGGPWVEPLKYSKFGCCKWVEWLHTHHIIIHPLYLPCPAFKGK
jgi:hypothetical protein